MESGTPPVAPSDASDATSLEERLRSALDEVRRLAIPDDHGSGERTARLSGLASWEFEVERLRALIEAQREGGPRA